MKRNKICESFAATRGLKEEDYDVSLDYAPEVQPEEEVIDVVDGQLKPGESGEEVSYIGRYVAICPVCAEPFFCGEEAQIIEGMCHDVCPVCQEEVDAQVVGVVNPLEEEDPEADPTTDGDPAVDPEDPKDPEDPPVEEGVKPKEEDVCEKCGKTPCECVAETTTTVSAPKFSLEFDESAMNSLLDQFSKENYPAMKSLTVERVVRKPSQLVIEAKIVTNKGERIAHLVAENFKVGRKMKMEMSCRELGAPLGGICIEARLKGGAIIPEAMAYDYTTRILSEGKMRKAQVSGSHKA